MTRWGYAALSALLLAGAAPSPGAEDRKPRGPSAEQAASDPQDAARLEQAEPTEPGSARSELWAFNDEGVLVFVSPDESFKWWIDGRIQLDMATYLGSSNNLSDGVELRRLRFGMKSVLWKDWSSELDFDLADNDLEVKDAWIAYGGLGRYLPEGIGLDAKLGHFKEPFSLEEMTSSRQLVFMERALPNVFAPGRHVGGALTAWDDRWRVSAGVFGQELGDEDEGADIGDNESWGSSARVTAVPFRGERTLFHVGASGMVRKPDADDESSDVLRFRQRAESHVERERFLNTGKFDGVRRYHAYGGEAALVHGPFLVQGEYIETLVDRSNGARDARFSGWYVMGAWALTGESRAYVPGTGEFGPIVPGGGAGAVELAVRYSTLDLTDGSSGIFGGTGRNVTVGANWFPNRHLRLSLNFVHVDNDRHADADGDFEGGDDFEIVQGRVQLVF